MYVPVNILHYTYKKCNPYTWGDADVHECDYNIHGRSCIGKPVNATKYVTYIYPCLQAPPLGTLLSYTATTLTCQESREFQ